MTMSSIRSSGDVGPKETGISFSRVLSVSVVALFAISLASCSTFGGGKKKKDKNRIPGERISVLAYEGRLEADPRLSDLEVRLPSPYRNEAWPQGGGFVSHAMHHLQVGSAPDVDWKANAGSGSGGVTRLVAQPIVADGVVFTLDAAGYVSANRTGDGRRMWRVELDQKGEKRASGFGGGIAYDGGAVYATSGYGYVAKLDAASGREFWRQETEMPMRGAPTVAGGRVFALSYDNQLYAFSAEDGRVLWYHVGIAENAGILGTASPAVEGDTVVAAYSSGEVYALRAENGQPIWSDALNRSGGLTPMSALNDVDGNPVIDRGMVYATSQGGRTVAIDFRTGERVWERNLGGVQTPWVAGDFIFLITSENEVVCLARRDGRVKWVRELQKYGRPDKRKDPLYWAGPVLVSDRLVLVSSLGYALSISPYTGEILSQMKLPGPSYISPVVANDSLYIFTDKGDLVALK